MARRALIAQLLQGGGAQGQGRLEGLAHDLVGALGQQLVGVAAVQGPGDDRQVGEVLAWRP